ncbi:uncharacterized protein [Watersipora subatra]|uniref:uncharacterized protein n=1 Tax=Watersipora subatra TaxID=2589382 RepID=UPI00355AEFD7
MYAIQHIRSKMPRCYINIMGERIPFALDTGACSNIIGVVTYNKLKSKHSISLQAVNDDDNLFGYGSKRKSDLCGSFSANVQCGHKMAHALFYVFIGVAKCLLSHETAVSLSLVSYSDNVLCNIFPGNSDDIIKSFPTVFQGLGKLVGYYVKFHIGPTVEPVAQPLRRTPFWNQGGVT